MNNGTRDKTSKQHKQVHTCSSWPETVILRQTDEL